MDYDRIREIAARHHLEITVPLLEAMHQAAGEAAQEMKVRYIDALDALEVPNDILQELNRRVKPWTGTKQ
jgi:6,7-dimethyl-8-ribityllumazine synthase